MTDLITASAIEARYPNEDAVFTNVSLTIRSDENVSILGPSGSGKSTLLKTLANVRKPFAGEVKYAVVNGHSVRPGLMFQQPLLLPWLSVGDNVSLGAAYVSYSDEQLNPVELIEQVGLTGLANRRTHELSGGQRQRAALARALAFRPDVLFLDEPFSALDSELRASLRQLVRDLARKRSIPVVLVTHFEEEALVFGGKIIRMNELLAESKLPNHLPATGNVAQHV